MFPVLLIIQFQFNYYIIQVSHIKCHVLAFSLTNLIYYFSITFYNIHIKYLTNYNNKLETLIIASTGTLKWQKMWKCGKDEVLKLVQDYLEVHISRESFDD